MTREEAKSLFVNNFNFKINKQFGAVMDIVDKIYNDFESHICKNCKWFEPKDEEERFWDEELIGYCKNKDLWEGLYKRITVEDFGCRKFKRKEDE